MRHPHQRSEMMHPNNSAWDPIIGQTPFNHGSCQDSKSGHLCQQDKRWTEQHFTFVALNDLQYAEF
jgi:hypothetical protein